MTRETPVATTPTSREMRPPYSTRASRSRPSWSVPNQYCQEGLSAMRDRSCTFGCGSHGSSGPRKQAATISASASRENMAARLRESRRKASLHREEPCSSMLFHSLFFMTPPSIWG